VPAHLTIDVIGVDADVEILEIVQGEMQQPTGAEDVAWYKESARLGERGNVLIAGHLNFWGVPEGVFFLLETLRAGDRVEIEGDDGQTYRYVVQWTQDFPSDEEPPEEALGQPEDEEALTMITCGGEWNAGRAEYDHRTLVRAVRDTGEPVEMPESTPQV
jgi:sortase (surface protein transpeptidase)